MKSILFISKSFYPSIGGVEKHVEMVSTILAKNGYSVTILTPYIDSDASNKRDNFAKFNRLKIEEFKHTKTKILGLFNIWFNLFTKISYVSKFDIVHVHDVFIWILPLKLILINKPFYSTFHGWEGIFPIPLKNKIIRRLSTKLSKKYFEVGEYIRKYYKTGKRGKLIYGAVDINNKSHINKTKQLVYVGRLSKDTGLDRLITYIKESKLKIKVEFCGDGPMRNECKEIGEVHGFVDSNFYISRAKYVFASGYLTILESFANKSVVLVASNNELKTDYYNLTPFRKWLNFVNSREDLENVLFHTSNKELNSRVEIAHKWVYKNSWSGLANNYLKLWSAL